MRAPLRSGRGSDAATRRYRRLSAIAAVVVVLAVVLAACSDGGSGSSPGKQASGSGAAVQQASAQPAGTEAAIAQYLEGQGHGYAGDCATATRPQGAGKWCTTRKSSDDPTAGTETYDAGPVGGAPQQTITLTRRSAARLTPGFQVGVAAGNVGDPHQLTRRQLEADAFITGNLLLDQQAGIGNGLGDLPAGAPTDRGGGGGSGGGTGAGTAGSSTSVYPPNGNIVIDDPNPQVGGEVVFAASGCQPNGTLQVSFDGQPTGVVTSDAQGRFTGSISVPQGAGPGTHRLTARGAGCVFDSTIDVAGKLAFTGSSSNTGTYVLVGIAAVMVGSVLVIGSRRRRRRGIRAGDDRRSRS